MAKRLEVAFSLNFKYTMTGEKELPDASISEDHLETLAANAKELLDNKVREILNIQDCDATLEFTHS
jgi:hypothetical protein